MSKICETNTDGVYSFFCPGCKCGHWFSTSGRTPSHPDQINTDLIWTFNGDVEKPTVRASILVQGFDWKTKKDFVCHSFITDGKIQFLGDCTHDLKGQTVDLEDI